MIDDSLPPEISEVNVVPLADVSLVLLMILLVLSPMMRHRLLPVRQAGHAPAAPAAELLGAGAPDLVLVVGLDADGFALGARRLAGAAELAPVLRAELERRSDKKVFLSPAPDVAVELVVRALETIQACGARSVALVQSQDQPHAHGPIPAPAPAP